MPPRPPTMAMFLGSTRIGTAARRVAWRSRLAGLDAAVRRFDWRTVVDDYDDRIEGLVAATA